MHILPRFRPFEGLFGNAFFYVQSNYSHQILPYLLKNTINDKISGLETIFYYSQLKIYTAVHKGVLLLEN